MTRLLAEFALLTPLLVLAAIATASTMAVALILQRTAIGILRVRGLRRVARYRPLINQALAGDEAARLKLAETPSRKRLAIAWLLIEPLIDDRDPARIARSREIAESVSLFDTADRYLRSRLWWRRALVLRALGLVNARDYTGELVAALDDPHPDVRAAALDALTDQRNPEALHEILERVHDSSLHRGRRGAALKAFGSACEPLLLEWSARDVENRFDYTQALGICGTARSRPTLCLWTRDPRLEVRATAFEALGYVGLDDETARVVMEGLESHDPPVRAMAAFALRGWLGAGAAARLAPRLDDVWIVAVQAARSLATMGQAGLDELHARTSREGLGGILARQMLWQANARLP